tara:strand:- start:3627 stop:3911 length:285 start_codon:yes stop_codon:yes gene_type:complete
MEFNNEQVFQYIFGFHKSMFTGSTMKFISVKTLEVMYANELLLSQSVPPENHNYSVKNTPDEKVNFIKIKKILAGYQKIDSDRNIYSGSLINKY